MKQADDKSRRRFLKLSSMLGLAVAFRPGTIAAAIVESKFTANKEEKIMTNSVATQPGADKTAIRPFQFNFPDAQLADLRRRINATIWPERETGERCNAGRAARDDAKTRAVLGHRLRLAQVRGETESPAAVHHRDRWARHSFHSCSFEA